MIFLLFGLLILNRYRLTPLALIFWALGLYLIVRE